MMCRLCGQVFHGDAHACLPPERDVKTLWAKLEANIAKLESCAGPHVFFRVEEKRLGGKCRCSVCGGEVETLSAGWYERGLEHGRRQRGDDK